MTHHRHLQPAIALAAPGSERPNRGQANERVSALAFAIWGCGWLALKLRQGQGRCKRCDCDEVFHVGLDQLLKFSSAYVRQFIAPSR